MKHLKELQIEAKYAISQLEVVRDIIRDIINKELHHTKARDVNITLVKKLQEVDNILKDFL